MASIDTNFRETDSIINENKKERIRKVIPVNITTKYVSIVLTKINGTLSNLRTKI